MGAKHALTQTLLTLIGEGDSVVFPNPGYPPDEFWVTYAGGHVLYAPLTEPDFAWDLAALEALLAEHGPRLLILNTPQRPNGMIVANLAEISELCLRYGTLVLSDEIFSHRVYTPSEHKSITALPGMAEQSIAVDTFSKTYIMTGFRIGWSVANPELCTLLDIFQQNSVTNVPAFVQQAALAALTGPQDQVEHTTKLLRAKRDKVVDALNQMPGVTCAPPDGSFYIFPDIQRTGLSAQEASDFLTEQFSVATVAGTAFGSLGEGHIRITYACPDEMLDEGIDRLGQAFDAIEAGRAG
jgi:aspartate/methionine/tyrosine aminotransferase